MSDILGRTLSFGGINTRDPAPQVENLTLKGGDGKIDATFSAVDAAYASLVKYYVVTANTHMPNGPNDGVSVMVMPGTGTLSCVLSGLENGVIHHVRVFIRCTYGWQTSPMAYGAATPMAGTLLSDIAASDATTEQIVMLPEQSVPVKFILLKHNYENSGRSLVCRKDLYDERIWDSSNNDYATSDIDTWLTGTYLNLIDAEIRAQIAAVNIKSSTGNGTYNVRDLSRKVFLLSYTEVGFPENSRAKIEGTALPYFCSNIRRIAYLNGTSAYWWLRTPNTGNTGMGWYVKGADYGNGVMNSGGSRPAFTLPAGMLFNPEPNPDGSYSPLAV